MLLEARRNKLRSKLKATSLACLMRKVLSASSSLVFAGTHLPDIRDTNTQTAEGAIGGTAQAVGGPFDKEGMIGKHFKQDGALGGSVQGNLGDQK